MYPDQRISSDERFTIAACHPVVVVYADSFAVVLISLILRITTRLQK